MKGNPTCLNYAFSGKWQPIYNEFAWPSQCWTKKVRPGDLKWPNEGHPITDLIKGCLGQRVLE